MNRSFLPYALFSIGLSFLLSKAGAAEPANPAAAAPGIVVLDQQQRGNWQVQSGEWVFGENDLMGSGDSAMDFKGPFEPPFTLSFRVKVIKGIRLRVKVGEVTLANLGERHQFQVALRGPNVAYKPNQEYQIAMEVRRDGVDVLIDGVKKLSTSKVVGPIPVITFRSGDYYSKGTAHFGDIVIRQSHPLGGSGIASGAPAAPVVSGAPESPSHAPVPVVKIPPPSKQIEPFLEPSLNAVLAPLGDNPPMPRIPVEKLRASLGAGVVTAKTPARQQIYQCAIAVCDALTNGMDERAQARAAAIQSGLLPSISTGGGIVKTMPLHGWDAGHAGDAIRGKQKDERAYADKQAKGVSNFADSAAYKAWVAKTTILRDNAMGLYSKLVQLEAADSVAESAR